MRVEQWIGLVLVISLIVGVVVHVCLLSQEYKLILRPNKCDSYRCCAPTDTKTSWMWLPSGALVVTIHPHEIHDDEEEEEEEEGREIMFFHGNAGNLDNFEPMARRLADLGYCVRMLEYRGYGVTKGVRMPTSITILEDAMEAWKYSIQDHRRSIMAGFSLGGGCCTQLLQTLSDEHMPAQVLLINTFFSFPQLVRENLPCSYVLASLMKTRWCARAGLERFVNNHLKRKRTHRWPRTLIVATKDDKLMSNFQSQQLLHAASVHSSKLIQLPSGGHREGPILHWNRWSPYLAPS